MAIQDIGALMPEAIEATFKQITVMVMFVTIMETTFGNYGGGITEFRQR